MRTHPYDAFAIAEEVFGLAFLHGVHVVIKIQELLIQVLYAMQKHLNGRTVERREKLLRNNILMQHDVYLFAIDPCRHLTVM